MLMSERTGSRAPWTLLLSFERIERSWLYCFERVFQIVN
jgi:hypothetical protein